NLKKSPFNRDGSWGSVASRLAVALLCEPVDLFSEELLRERDSNQASMEVDAAEVGELLLGTRQMALSADAVFDGKELVRVVEEQLATLTPREAEVVRARFGLGEDGEETPLSELARRQGCSKERIRQIDACPTSTCNACPTVRYSGLAKEKATLSQKDDDKEGGEEQTNAETASLTEAAKQLSRRGARKGGEARARKLTPVARAEIAKKAAAARWKDKADIVTEPTVPEAKYKGFLNLMNLEIPCYVLDDGQRVIGRTSATEMLTGIKGGGDLEKYLGVQGFKPYVDIDLVLEGFVSFRLPEVEGLERAVKGLPADLFIEICRGLVAALDASEMGQPDAKLTLRQRQIAIAASRFLAACAKVGLDALIDEATGNQYERAEDALQVKLRAYLEEEMRAWQKTFPDDLWLEFGRLTGWKGTVSQRPKYWGKLVNELVYDYLDPDVAQWLRENAPKPRHGQNYHQWLSSQYGLKKLVEHLWKLIGIASTCKSMHELRQRMAEMSGRQGIQYTLYLPIPTKKPN
ncbi:MAG TPA: P63C domain-containing protein, partial [Vicinamibacteria bacterium]|nr:P63C domain-containing protein [Vicinamibacteria bacterium]